MADPVTITVSGATLALIAERLFAYLIAPRLARKEPQLQFHKSFADDEDKYWRQMREVVTEPLSKVLEGTNAILSELRDKAIREEGREEGLRKRK